MDKSIWDEVEEDEDEFRFIDNDEFDSEDTEGDMEEKVRTYKPNEIQGLLERLSNPIGNFQPKVPPLKVTTKIDKLPDVKMTNKK